MKKLFLFIIISAFFFTSCKKDKNKNDCSLTEANLVGSYKITSVKYKASASSPEIDYSNQFFDEACQKDDITTFNADHTYIYSDAGTACSPKGDDNGTWTLTNNVVSVDGEPGTLQNFSCSGFTAVGTDINTTGDQISVAYTKQ